MKPPEEQVFGYSEESYSDQVEFVIPITQFRVAVRSWRCAANFTGRGQDWTGSIMGK